MGRKKKILAGICVLCLLVLNVLIVCHRGSVGGNYELHLTMNSDKEQEIQVYYSAAGELSEKSSQVKTYDQVEKVRNWFFLFHFSLIWCVWIWARSRDHSLLKMFILDVKIQKQRFRR